MRLGSPLSVGRLSGLLTSIKTQSYTAYCPKHNLSGHFSTMSQFPCSSVTVDFCACPGYSEKPCTSKALQQRCLLTATETKRTLLLIITSVGRQIEFCPSISRLMRKGWKANMIFCHITSLINHHFLTLENIQQEANHRFGQSSHISWGSCK